MDPEEIIAQCESVIEDSDTSTDSTALAAVCLIKGLAMWLHEMRED